MVKTDKDYYHILGVSLTAAPDDIKKAYHLLAMRFHPDHNPGDSTAVTHFKEINEAYEVLGDTFARSEYDRLHAPIIVNQKAHEPNLERRFSRILLIDAYQYLTDTLKDIFINASPANLNVAASLLLLYLFQLNLQSAYRHLFAISLHGGLIAIMHFSVFLIWIFYLNPWHWLIISTMTCMCLLPLKVKKLRLWHVLLGTQLFLMAVIVLCPSIINQFAMCYETVFSIVQKPCLCPV